MPPKKMISILILAACGLLLLSVLVSGCAAGGRERKVVVYTSVDQHYSEPVLKKFEQETGIKVLPVYDVEAAKTTGLVNRLIAEKKQPQADVFWNSEFVQTMLLKESGVLAAYRSPSAQGIPGAFCDQESFWTGFGGRARVLIVNTDLVEPADFPRSIFDLTGGRWSGQEVGIAYPLFGTSATHAAALYAVLGPQEGKKYFDALKTKGVQVVDGNSVVRDLVAQGRLKAGLTDTDDAYQAVSEGDHVKIIVPDQEDMGVFIIPNTVAMIAGAPNPEEAGMMIDYLLSPAVENDLTASGFIQVPLRAAGINDEAADWSGVKKMDVNFESVYKNLENVKYELSQIFIR
jgi:iron(III) transport system substrate-binding protein